MARKIKLTQVGPVKKEDMKINYLKGIVRKINGLKRNLETK